MGLFNKEGLSKNGEADLMGNLKAESNLNQRIYENKYKGTIGLTDEEYINKINNSEYINFIHDKFGFGLAQWYYYTRKENFFFKLSKRKKFFYWWFRNSTWIFNERIKIQLFSNFWVFKR